MKAQQILNGDFSFIVPSCPYDQLKLMEEVIYQISEINRAKQDFYPAVTNLYRFLNQGILDEDVSVHTVITLYKKYKISTTPSNLADQKEYFSNLSKRFRKEIEAYRTDEIPNDCNPIVATHQEWFDKLDSRIESLRKEQSSNNNHESEGVT